MTRFDVRRIFTRRKLESAGVMAVALAGAVGIAKHGTLVENPVPAAVTQIMAREVPASGAATRVASRERAAGVTWDLPNLDHKFVDAWVRRFTTDQKQSMTVYLARMGKYEDMIAAKAEEHGVPQDLVYLALIESGGNPTAKSPVSARGLWQFMAPTARQYGLTVRGKRDDRVDPAKSTDAALKYLGDLHARFGSWYLAAAAYNTGQGRVSKVLKQVTGKTKGTDEDFYKIAGRLPKETRDYVPKLIAAARIAKEPGKYGFAADSTPSGG